MDRRTSSIWGYFTIFDQLKYIAKCDTCQKKYSYKSTLTNLRKHLSTCHGINLPINTLNVST